MDLYSILIALSIALYSFQSIYSYVFQSSSLLSTVSVFPPNV